MKVAVLASGQGTNLRRLAEVDAQGGLYPAKVSAVATNRAHCGAADFAREAKLQLGVFSQRDYASSEARDLAMRDWLIQLDIEMVVLAGYDRVLSRTFSQTFPDRILNVHPSLLPAFGGGMHAIEAALEAGVKVTGCTVHLLGEEVDGGPILLQAAVPVLPDDTAVTLRERVHAEEHRLLPQAVRLVASGHLRRVGQRAMLEQVAEPVG